MAATAEAIPLRLDHHCLACMASDQSSTAGRYGLAGLARPFVLTQGFNVGPASGAIAPAVTVNAPEPGQDEVGLLGPVTVRLSLQRLVSITIEADNGQVIAEQKALGGLKRPGDWFAFTTLAGVVISNPSTSFYVVGSVVAPIWYLVRPQYDALRSALGGELR